MSRFTTVETPLAGLVVLRRSPIADPRGYLERVYCADELSAVQPKPIVQINRTLTRERGALRGMHFQHPPYAEAKLITCLRGEVFDVAIDLRRGSETFLQWHAEVLRADDHTTLLVPEGFAHGFQTLTENCEMLYMHSAAYHQGAEGGLNALDPTLAISWPLPITDMSARDRGHEMLTDAFRGLDL
jgi:dTDP-4-dehydrorhamnose 3,5-epimerase